MKTLVIALLLIVTISTVQAESFSDCVGKKPEKARLACYDLAAKNLSVASKPVFLPEQKTAIDNALKALRKINSATRTKISKFNYAREVIEMTQIVDTAVSEIPSSDIAALFKQAQALYFQAQSTFKVLDDASLTSWQGHGPQYVYVFMDSSEGHAIINKFGLKPNEISLPKDRELVMRPIWAWANRRTQVASELLKTNTANDATAMAFVEGLDKFARANNLGESTDELLTEITDWHGQRAKFVEEICIAKNANGLD